MAITALSHDPFARTTLMRGSYYNRSFKRRVCDWCGSEPRHLFTYWIKHDDDNTPDANRRPYTAGNHYDPHEKWYCNMECAGANNV